MPGISLQVQSVLYKNEVSSLRRSILSFVNAVKIAKKNGVISKVKLCYGDASSVPVLDKELVSEFSLACDGIDFEYNFFDKNTGSAKGHNILGEKCACDYMLIMNPDVLLSPHTIEKLLYTFSNSNTGMVEARQTPIEHPKDYSSKTLETSWATTACAVFPASIFHELGGFDSNSFFMYCDDLDFSWRVRLLGKKIIYQPLAPVFHAKRLSSKGEWKPTDAEKYYSAEAALMMAYKWSNPKQLERLLKIFSENSDKTLSKAYDEFIRRKNSGDLPEKLDPEHKVATFVGDNYTKHRFVL